MNLTGGKMAKINDPLGLFTKGDSSAPAFAAAASLPTRDDAAVKEAERLQREEEVRRRRGSLSTVLTSGMGVSGEAQTDAPALRPTLG